MSIAPIVHEVLVKVPPARAFDLFVTHMEHWWPKGRTIGKNSHAAIVTEPCAGGRWYGRDVEGNENNWGKVLAWEPPSRLLLAWQINGDWKYDPDLITEVEVRFTPLEGGETRVELEHRNIERFGDKAERVRTAIDSEGGWSAIVKLYAEAAERRA